MADNNDEAYRLLADAAYMLADIERARELPPTAQARQQYEALAREISTFLWKQRHAKNG